MQQSIAKIISVTATLEHFWRHSHGWAPEQAANLLASARLDRQTSFANTLYDYVEPFEANQAEAKTILGYATLRSLCEGLLKLFFGVWLEDYLRDQNAFRDRYGRIVPPEKLTLDRLIKFYSKKIDITYEDFLRRVQHRGNSIHHFTDRDIGTQAELRADIINFEEFLVSVNAGIPYPDK